MFRLRMLPLLAALALSTGTALSACDKGGADKGEKKAEGGDKADVETEENAEGAEPTDTEAEPAEGGEPAAEAGEPAAEGSEGEDGDEAEETEGGDEGDEGKEDGGAEADTDDEGGDKGDDEGGEEKAGGSTGGTKTTKKKDPPKPEKASADKANGKTLFLKKCKSCHAPDGSGKTKLGEKYEIESLKGTKLSTSKIVSILVKGIPDTKMKSYKSKLSDQEMQDVAAFVKTL